MTKRILYTPWRREYVTSNKQKKEGCVFCAKLQEDAACDRQNHVLHRGSTVFVVMNIYPYNPGHLMILPHYHVATLPEIAPDTQIEMMLLTSYFTELLTELMQPDGFNIGTNIGQAAGAGIASHLHTHLVPRWAGDANFMSVVSETRVLPETLDETYDKIVTLVEAQPPSSVPH